MHDYRASEFKIGFLVAAGLAALVAVILQSEKIDFEPEYRITVFLDSASGLRSGSPVTMSGLPIGTVGTVRAITDPRGNVAATVLLKDTQIIRDDAVVTLSTNGIFGDSYIAFENAGLAGRELPRDDSAVMVAQKSFLGRAADKLGTLVERIDSIVDQRFVDDAKGIVHNLHLMSGDGAKISAAFASKSDRLGPMLDNADAVLIAARDTLQGLRVEFTNLRTRFDQVGKDLQPVLQEAHKALPKLAASLDNALSTTSEAIAGSQEELVKVRKELAPMLGEYRQFGAHLNAIMAELRQGRGVVGQLLMSQSLAKDMNDMVIDAKDTTSRIADDPSLLLWGSKPVETQRSRDRRQRAQLRRSFDYGFGSPAMVPEPEEEADGSSKSNGKSKTKDNASTGDSPQSGQDKAE